MSTVLLMVDQEEKELLQCLCTVLQSQDLFEQLGPKTEPEFL